MLAVFILAGVNGLVPPAVHGDDKSFKAVLAKAKQGDAESQFNLGWMYEQGEGVLQVYVSANAWYNIAASQKHDEAKYNRDFVIDKDVPEPG